MRLGPVPGTGHSIAPGDTLLLTVDPAATGGDALPVQYAPLAREVRPGGTILIDDGRGRGAGSRYRRSPHHLRGCPRWPPP